MAVNTHEKGKRIVFVPEGVDPIDFGFALRFLRSNHWAYETNRLKLTDTKSSTLLEPVRVVKLLPTASLLPDIVYVDKNRDWRPVTKCFAKKFQASLNTPVDFLRGDLGSRSDFRSF